MDLDAADVRAFAARDWARIEALKSQAWLALKRRSDPGHGIRLGASMLERARAEHPEWPTQADRQADHAALGRLVHKLRRASDELGL